MARCIQQRGLPIRMPRSCPFLTATICCGLANCLALPLCSNACPTLWMHMGAGLRITGCRRLARHCSGSLKFPGHPRGPTRVAVTATGPADYSISPGALDDNLLFPFATPGTAWLAQWAVLVKGVFFVLFTIAILLVAKVLPLTEDLEARRKEVWQLAAAINGVALLMLLDTSLWVSLETQANPTLQSGVPFFS